MNAPQENVTTVSRLQGVVNVAWPFVTSKRGLIVLAVGTVVAGLALNWSWLVAVGIAPILLAVLPCAAMCALGLCMNKGGDKSCATGDKTSGRKRDIKVDRHGNT